MADESMSYDEYDDHFERFESDAPSPKQRANIMDTHGIRPEDEGPKQREEREEDLRDLLKYMDSFSVQSDVAYGAIASIRRWILARLRTGAEDLEAEATELRTDTEGLTADVMRLRAENEQWARSFGDIEAENERLRERVEELEERIVGMALRTHQEGGAND